MTVGELIEMLKMLPEESTIGILELLFLNSTGYDKIVIKPKEELDVVFGVKDRDYYIIGKYSEWEPPLKENIREENKNE